MEGITTGIRPEGSKKVKIKAPVAEEAAKVTSKIQTTGQIWLQLSVPAGEKEGWEV